MANKLRLLRYRRRDGGLHSRQNLTERHARAALRIEDADERLAALRHIANGA
jgi:hypothetical protein